MIKFVTCMPASHQSLWLTVVHCSCARNMHAPWYVPHSHASSRNVSTVSGRYDLWDQVRVVPVDHIGLPQKSLAKHRHHAPVPATSLLFKMLC